MVWLWISALAVGQTFDEYASQPEWVCSYGAETNSCAGDVEFAGIAAQKTVVFCPTGALPCETSWRLSGDTEALQAAFLAWGSAVEEDLGSREWMQTPALVPQAWSATNRTKRRQAVMELGEGYLLVKIAARPECAADQVVEQLDPLVRAASAEPRQENWPEATDMSLPGVIDEAAWELASSGVGAASWPANIHRLNLLAAEPLACFQAERRLESSMGAVRRLYEEWEQWRSPDPRLVRQAEREERIAVREARKRKRDIEVEPVDVPDELGEESDTEPVPAADTDWLDDL